jgi:hypothetical protein
MTNAFEYGDALLPDREKSEGQTDGETAPPQTGSNTPYLNLAT